MENVFVYDDGGRAAAGYQGITGDCVCRAIAIATQKPYQEVYDALFEGIKEFAKGRSKAAKRSAREIGSRGTTPRNGVARPVYHKYLTEQCGMVWVPFTTVGSGCTVHLEAKELPPGRIICRLSKHLTAVIDGVIHDIYNPQRPEGSRTWFKGDGTKEVIGQRQVYGIYKFPN